MCGADTSEPPPPLRPSCFCCGVRLNWAVRIVLLVELIVGIAYFAFLFFYGRHICDPHVHQEKPCYAVAWLFPSGSSRTGRDKRTWPNWLPTVCLVFAIAQCALIPVLYTGVSKRNRKLCAFWIVFTSLFTMFNGIILHLYQILVVGEFCREIFRLERNALGANCRIQPNIMQTHLSSIAVESKLKRKY